MSVLYYQIKQREKRRQQTVAAHKIAAIVVLRGKDLIVSSDLGGFLTVSLSLTIEKKAEIAFALLQGKRR